MFGKTTEFCHVCNYPITLKKNEPLPPICPVCGADLANRASETLVSTIECEHIKGAIGAGDGVLYASNRRLFFIKGKVSAESMGGGLANSESGTNFALGGLAAKALSKGSGKASVSIPLENIGGIEDCKKGLRKGVTLHTKSGESYNFFLLAAGDPNRGKLEDLKGFFTPYVNN
jgi:hypothetical protein